MNTNRSFFIKNKKLPNIIIGFVIIIFIILLPILSHNEEELEPQQIEKSLQFNSNDSGSFSFDTGILSGILREEGKSIGLIPVYYKNDSTPICAREGILNHYRVFTKGKRYGNSARKWQSTAKLNKDGSVSVLWPNTADRPFELKGIYKIVSPNVIDLTTVVHAKQDLKDFEVFIASYFSQSFIESRVWSSKNPGQETEPSLVSAKRELGKWLVFPRNEHSVEMINDGRWTIEPHPMEWTFMPYYELPLAIRQDKESRLTIITLTKKEDCFAIFTPYNEDKHYSHYFSLFGYDITKGEVAKAHTRMIVLQNPTDTEILKIANEFFQK